MKIKLLPDYIVGQKPDESSKILFVKSLDGCDIALSETSISFSMNGVAILSSKLIEFEKEPFFLTHVGQFDDGIKFRIVQAVGVAKQMLALQGKKPYFTFASLNPIGYAIDFEFV